MDGVSNVTPGRRPAQGNFGGTLGGPTARRRACASTEWAGAALRPQARAVRSTTTTNSAMASVVIYDYTGKSRKL